MTELSRDRLRRRKMFDVKKEKVEIVASNGNKDVYEVSPLTGEYLEDLYYVMEKFQDAGEDEKAILKALGTDAVKKLHGLVYASLEGNYPNVDKKQLNQFISQNLMTFIGPVIKVNVPQAE